MPAAKLIVLGRGEAGKSTLIARLASNAVNLEVGGRTIAMDHGVLTHAGWRISLVGVPGQPRFAAVREILARGAAGAIWVHPAGDEPDPDTVELLVGNGVRRLPYVVFVNQRAGTASAMRFPRPPVLHAPITILQGDLASEQLALRELSETAWRLASAASQT